MKKQILCGISMVSALAMNAQSLPKPDHVIIVMLENKGYSNIIGSANAPYINSLVNGSKCAVFSQSYGVTHPSQPNYISLFSGQNQGVTNDNQPSGTPWTTCNMGRNLLDASYTFAGFSEDLPAMGSLVNTSGNYAQKHCPWTFWQGTGINQIPPTTNQPYTAFPDSLSYSSLPTVSFIIPNLAHDMHDPIFSPTTAITTGDTWLKNNIKALASWVKTHNSLLIIHYDEDEGFNIGGISTSSNNIPTMFIGEMVQKATYTNRINHYTILRTIEEMYALPYCDSSANYQAINNCWLLTGVQNDAHVKGSIALYPNPAHTLIHANVPELKNAIVSLQIMDVTGRIIKRDEVLLNNAELTVSTSDLQAGHYTLMLKSHSKVYRSNFVIE